MSLSEVFLLRKKRQKSMAGAVGSEEMCSYMLIRLKLLQYTYKQKGRSYRRPPKSGRWE